jgi:hypothetical protein
MKSLAIIVCAVLCAGVAHAGELATDDEHGISLRAPDGYTVFKEGLALPRAIFAYARGAPGEPGFELLGVTGLGGTIGRESFDPKPIVQQMATALGLTVDKSSRRGLAWKGFELDGFVATMRQGELVATLAGVQVPVRGEAVQIVMMRLGDKDIGDELQAVLATFEAESNWLTTDERIQKLVVGGLTFLTFVTVVVVLVIRRRRRARQSRAA